MTKHIVSGDTVEGLEQFIHRLLICTDSPATLVDLELREYLDQTEIIATLETQDLRKERVVSIIAGSVFMAFCWLGVYQLYQVVNG